VPACAKVQLANQGKTAYTIVVPNDATSTERYAAEELADFLGRMTGATFPVATEGVSVRGPKVALGRSALVRKHVPTASLDALGEDGFIIKTAGKDLLLAGGRPRGTLYAVYHLLDNMLGIRWWAPGATEIPSTRTLTLDKVNVRSQPTFDYRDVFLTTAWDPDWAACNRLNGRVRLKSGEIIPPDEQHGGGMPYDPSFVHSFNSYIPSAVHFDAHPEWFSMINGERKKGYYQLCLSNPEVVDFMVAQVRATLKTHPEIRIFSISQNDTGGNCQCPNCARIDREEGSPSGTIVRFVNAVAERVEKEYPNVLFDTLAYQYSRKPPKITKPRKNVIIRLCSIECSFSQPLDSPANQAFVHDIKGWAQITDNIYIWDYITNFGNYFRPHPNLRVLGPNLRLFAANNVKGVFAQGSYITPSGEMEELRAWVLARLMWNPQQDDRALIDEFVHGYYGAAAPYVREYLAMIHDAMEQANAGMNCYAGDPSPHVTFDIMTKAETLFTKAEAAVADQPEVLTRVKRAHMPVQMMWLTHYGDWAVEAKQRGLPAPQPLADILAAFEDQVKTDGVTHFNEGRSMSTWLASFKKQISHTTVRSSGSYGGGMPWDIFDGDPKTVLNFGGFGPQWIQRDLEAVKTITAITSDFSTYYATIRYRIEASDDEITWTVIVPDKTITTSTVTDTFSMPIAARYVKTTILQAGSAANPNEWVGMAEQTISTEK
jgi:hypothetical protein